MKFDGLSMSPDIARIENVGQLLKTKPISKTLTTYQSLVSAIKQGWKSLALELAIVLVRSMNNKIS